MNTKSKRSITATTIHVAFILCTFLVNAMFPNEVKYAPEWGILVIFAWSIYTILATLKSLILFVEKKENRLVPLLIHVGVLTFLVVVFFTIGFGRFADFFSIRYLLMCFSQDSF